MGNLCPGRHVSVFVFLILVFGLETSVIAQSSGPISSPSPSPTASPKPSLERHFFINVLKDQYGIWTFPLRIRQKDLPWALPLAGATAILFATDEQTAHLVSNNSTELNISHGVSQAGSGYAVTGAAATIYLVGRLTHDQRARETGILAFEALIDTGIVTQVFKVASQRARPTQQGAEGEFFTHGSSFFSGHSSSIWSLAAVLDDEYGKRHKLIRFGVFGLATAVSLSRYTGQNHFLSDIVLGGAVGYGIGHFVYLRHHDSDIDRPPGIIKPTTKLEKYFPYISPEIDGRTKTYRTSVTWNF
jgi:membrane-associated phospholipid phosphatase